VSDTDKPSSKEKKTEVSAMESTPPSKEETIIVTPSKTEYKTYEIQTSIEEESVSAKAKEAGQSFKSLIEIVGKKAKDIIDEETKYIKSQAETDIVAKKDAQDIQRLGTNVEGIIKVFEDIITDIRKQKYNDQEKLLIGYKKLLSEQVNVINSRLGMAKQLKDNT